MRRTPHRSVAAIPLFCVLWFRPGAAVDCNDRCTFGELGAEALWATSAKVPCNSLLAQTLYTHGRGCTGGSSVNAQIEKALLDRCKAEMADSPGDVVMDCLTHLGPAAIHIALVAGLCYLTAVPLAIMIDE